MAVETEIEKRTCEKHGEYETRALTFFGNRKIWTTCPDCDAEISVRFKADEEARERRRHEQQLRSLGIPPRFQYATFDTYQAITDEQKRVLDICRHYVAEFDQVLEKGKALILCGSVGTGKTHLGMAAVRESAAKSYRSYYSTIMQMIRAIRETYKPAAEQSEQDLINRFVGYDLLVLDELGVQLGTESERLLLFEVIDGRYMNVKPTMLVSNLNLRDLTKYLGERALDRMREGGGQVLNFTWESYRKAKDVTGGKS